MSKVAKSAREAFERLSRRILMKKYPGTLVTTKLDKSSAIFIRYPIINSLASDRLPIFLPINRHRQPKDKPLVFQPYGGNRTSEHSNFDVTASEISNKK